MPTEVVINDRLLFTFLRARPHVSGYFWICDFFFPDSKISPFTRSVFKSNSPRPRVIDSTRIHSSTQGSSAPKCLQSMLRRAREWRKICSVRPTRAFKLTAILVYCSVRDWKRFLCPRILKYPDSPVHTLSDSLRIYIFPLCRGSVHTYPDIFESATFSFRIRLPSTRIRRIGQRIRKKINPLSRVEKNISASNPITCGRVNPDIFESNDVKSVSNLSPNNWEF